MVLFLLMFTLSLFFSEPISAQTTGLESLQEDFKQYQRRAVREKVYLHTDRSFYLAGETIWFKIYVVDGSEHKPLDLSKVVYVEILDKENKAVAQAKIAMEEGSGKGSFYLPLSLKSGNFKMRAYTQWMRNFSPDFYFQKALSISNTFLNTDFEPVEKEAAFNVQFFPEGGELVKGIRSKVGFKIVDRNGKGLDARGAVVKPNGDTVALLHPFRFGMGHFFLEPEAGISYHARVKAENGSPQSFTLPAVQERGYVLSLEDIDEEELEVQVRSNFPEQEVYLLVHTRQQVKFAEARKINGGKTSFKVGKSSLGEGISHITLFNRDKQAVAERLYFKYPEEQLRIKAETDKKQYASRQKVSVSLNTTQAVAEQSGLNLSMAVYRLDSLNVPEQENILSYLWLSSDLKGHIENPSFYFENRNKETREAMDNLLLSQGWRRFRWQEVLDKESLRLPFIPEYEGHLIQAVITDKNSGSPVRGVNSYLSAAGKLVQFYASNSNEEGQLRFVTEQLYGDKTILLQNYPASTGFRIRVKNPFSEEFSEFALAPFEVPKSKAEQLRRQHINMQVQNTYWQEERNKLLAPELDSVAFFGAPDITYLLEDYTRFPTMEEVMREYVYEVRVRKQNGKFLFKVFNPVWDDFFQTPPLVLLDGVLIDDVDKIMAYNPLKVEKLEIVKERFFLGKDIAFEGIISYTTYKGELEGFTLDPEMVKLDYEGLQLQREFYSPHYETGQRPSSRKPDFRALLYWAPEIRLAENGQTELSFFTSDLKGKFILEVQGISKEGKAGVQTVYFEVGEESL